ncbi:MAG: hypothetical protein AAGF36_14525 [Pseudomonadota bacterium]
MALPVLVALEGDIPTGFGLAVFVASFFVAPMVVSENAVVRYMLTRFSRETGKRTTSALAVFAFLAVPPCVALMTNRYAGTTIDMYALPLHVAWAGIGAAVVFFTVSADAD